MISFNLGDKHMGKKTDSNRLVRESVKRILSLKKPPIHDYYGSHVKFGLISDTHYGSLFENPDLLHLLYKIFKKEGIDSVYHCGDLIDGENMYRGHEYELHTHGASEQIKEVVERYPEFKGITTYFITGNHDQSFWNRAGIDIGEIISEKRKDLIYLGRDDADIDVGTPKKKVRLRLTHPSGGTAYAVSYHPQKMVESFTGGEKPDILCIGHYHKAEMLPALRNVKTIQAGCIQKQTPYMRRKRIQAHQGGWIIEFTIDKNRSVRKFKGEFIPWYEAGERLLYEYDL